MASVPGLDSGAAAEKATPACVERGVSGAVRKVLDYPSATAAVPDHKMAIEPVVRQRSLRRISGSRTDSGFCPRESVVNA